MGQQSQFFNQFCPENVSGNLIQVTYATERCNNRALHVEEGMAFQLYNLYIYSQGITLRVLLFSLYLLPLQLNFNLATQNSHH